MLLAFAQTFFALFGVIDSVGNVPFFLTFSRTLSRGEKEAFARSAVVYAGGILVIFMFLGNVMLDAFQISMASFRIAGGIALIFIGLKIMLGIEFDSRRDDHADAAREPSILPLATPLIAGPGTISLVIVLAKEYGFLICFSGILANLVLTYVLFRLAPFIIRIFGEKEVAVFANMMGLILVAIGVELIRKAFLPGLP